MRGRNRRSPWNPSAPVEITPTQFEKLVLACLRECGDGQPIETKHLGVVEGAGGEYKIDALANIKIFGGALVTVLVECKHQRRPVEREDALVLEAKLRDVGAHKGILFSTSGFQRGALQYAAGRGIATVSVVDGKWLYETKDLRSEPPEPPSWVRFDRHAGVRMTMDGESISSHTIEMGRVDALKEWFAKHTEASADLSR